MCISSSPPLLLFLCLLLFPSKLFHLAGGGFAELNMTAPSGQIAGGCFDGYGQTGPGELVSPNSLPPPLLLTPTHCTPASLAAYAQCGGPQVVTIRNMVAALGGPAYARGPCNSPTH